MKGRATCKYTIATFAAMIAAPALIQIGTEVWRGELPQALELFETMPTQQNIRAYEKALEDASITSRVLRPWVQAAQFFAMRDAGEQVVFGNDGWLFYRPGLDFLTQKPRPNDPDPEDALAAVVHFRDELAARGIQLLVVPTPNKESAYPDKLTALARSPERIIGRETRDFFAACDSAGIEIVDLFARFRDARESAGPPLYLAQDSHWSPVGMELAAKAVAEHIVLRGWLTPGSINYRRHSASTRRMGDLVRMARSPQIEECLSPEELDCVQIVHEDNSAPYSGDTKAEVLVLGDSFLRIYERDEPRSAGFVAHLAYALKRPVASIVNDGGASTLVRQELSRRPQLLSRTRVVVWEFVERDLRLGVEGWQVVSLPTQTEDGGLAQVDKAKR